MDHLARKHRTFELFNRSRRLGHNDCVQVRRTKKQHDRNRGLQASNRAGGGRSNMPPGLEAHISRMERVRQVRPSKPTTYDYSQTNFKAIQFLGNKMRNVEIVEWPGQDFAAYATPWELRFSSLVKKIRLKTTPLVDASYNVIGHVVQCRKNDIYAPRNSAVSSSTSYYLERDIPIFVDSEKSREWSEIGSSEQICKVVVAIDGSVLALLSTETIGLESVDNILFDVLSLGAGVLANVGKNAIKKSVRALTRRSTKEASETLGGRAAASLRKAASRITSKFRRVRGYIRETGMPQGHFKAMQNSAEQTGLVAVVRNTNPASMKLIERGCPAKPLAIKANTSPTTGVVMAAKKSDVDAAMRQGYYVVDADGVARRTVIKGRQKVVEELELRKPFWKVEPGQMIVGGRQPMPLVGDYDLMGVFDPANAGRNIALVTKGGRKVADISGPEVSRFRAIANGKLDGDRCMHGAQDQFASFRGGATVFHPDGTVIYLKDADAVEDYYKSIARQPRDRSYNPNIDSMPAPVDELAAMRAKKKRMAAAR